MYAVAVVGLSPPTRGIHSVVALFPCLAGSIPAYAGDPICGWRNWGHREVYPRLRGGSSSSNSRVLALAGLSPPTRGIQALPFSSIRCGRSIPAYAGDPAQNRAPTVLGRVYPRLRGGSFARAGAILRQPGLSPPTRGIPEGKPLSIQLPGSIPAYAGDPAASKCPTQLGRVYPRLRGGSDAKTIQRRDEAGLSPPTRGIRSPKGW